MHHRALVAMALAGLVAAAGGCTGATVTPPGHLPLVGPTWTVVAVITGDAVSSVPADVVASLRLQADGQVRVNTGCNEGGGTVAVADGTLRFGMIALTERACQGAAGQLEQDVLAVLGAEAVAYTIDASTMELRAGARGLRLAGS